MLQALFAWGNMQAFLEVGMNLRNRTLSAQKTDDASTPNEVDVVWWSGRRITC